MPHHRPDPLLLDPDAFIASDPVDTSTIAYADDQDPSILTDAGLVASSHARHLERAYVYAKTQAIICAVEDDRPRRTTILGRAHHEGACSMVAHLAELSAAPGLFRGTARLDRVARRILVGRARRILRDDPEDPLPRAILEQLLG